MTNWVKLSDGKLKAFRIKKKLKQHTVAKLLMPIFLFNFLLPSNFRHCSISVISVKWKWYIIRASILNLISIGESEALNNTCTLRPLKAGEGEAEIGITARRITKGVPLTYT